MHRPFEGGRPGWVRVAVISGGLLVLLAAAIPGAPFRPDADGAPAAKANKANYELAARWTPAKIGKMVFDVAVTPHWLEEGGKFWYAFENRAGRKLYVVDPVKKTRSFVFDPVKLAASLTTATGLPYDSQHLPITTIRFVKNDTSIQFEINVPKDAVIPGEKKTNATQQTTDSQQQRQPEADDAGDAPQQQQGGRGQGTPPPNRDQKQLAFEYELSSGKLTLLDERPPRKPTWASVSPDDKVVIFVRNRNLYMMDAANYAKALKTPNDTTIVETQITTDGVEDFGYGGRGMVGDQQQQQQQEQQQNDNQGDQQGQNQRNRTGPGNIAWSRDSKKFALVRRDERKVKPLWVINSLANPRPTLETYKYAMPGDADYPQPQLEVFDIASKARVVANPTKNDSRPNAVRLR